MTSRGSRRIGRPSLVAVIVLTFAVLVSAGGTAHAYWSARSAHTGTAAAGLTLPAPATMVCINQNIALVGSVARVSWDAVAGATGYRVVVTRASGGTPFQVDQPGTSIDLSSGVLGDLLGGLLAGTVLTVRVSPIYAQGASGTWVSSNSRAYQVTTTVLPIGTVCRGPA